MDDFVVANLHESKNEWCGRLVSILTPLVIEGFKSIFNESWKLCVDNNEVNKYLMTFQNLLSRIPKWNSVIIEEERKRIIERSGCNYLEDLITCVHIIQLKVLTCIRVGNKQKKIDISIPKLDSFLHRLYIHSARKIYMNIYLFEKKISDLQIQKNNRELEIIIQESILTTIRESIPTEAIIRAYLDESMEEEEQVIIEQLNEEEKEDVKKEGKSESKSESESVSESESGSGVDATKKEDLENPADIIPEVVPSITNIDEAKVVTRLSFNDVDNVSDGTSKSAPKDIESLERISADRSAQRKLEELDDADDEEPLERIKIHMNDPPVTLEDVFDLDNPPLNDVADLDFEDL
jgi:hypothetical protein